MDKQYFDSNGGLREIATSRGFFVGIDVISILRFDSSISEFGEAILERIFTCEERSYCEDQPRPSEHYAARFAAKEAFYKAIPLETPHVPFAAIEVTRTPGGPSLNLGKDVQPAIERSISGAISHEDLTTAISLSHDRTSNIAGAVVVVQIDQGMPE